MLDHRHLSRFQATSRLRSSALDDAQLLGCWRAITVEINRSNQAASDIETALPAAPITSSGDQWAASHSKKTREIDEIPEGKGEPASNRRPVAHPACLRVEHFCTLGGCTCSSERRRTRPQRSWPASSSGSRS